MQRRGLGTLDLQTAANCGLPWSCRKLNPVRDDVSGARAPCELQRRREASYRLRIMAATMIVQPETHWFNGWFLRLCARAVVKVDDVEYAARWGRPVHIEVGAGAHRVAVGARYRGTRPLLGAIEARVSAKQAEQVFVDARNGFFNHQPFQVTTRKKS